MISRFLAASLVLAVLAPVGAASHWAVHDSEFDDYARRTLEDDGATLSASGNPLDGRENRVVYPGSNVGDGTLFLDSMMGNRIGASAESGIDFYASAFVADLTGNPNLVLPGLHHVSAWYGWWHDVDSNGVIDDIHDGMCGAAPCPDDEFIWRGIGSRHNGVAVANFIVPDYSFNMRGGADPSTTTRVDSNLVDRTDHARPAQEWISSRTHTIGDASLLASMQSFTIAGARPAAGTYIGHDLTDPAGLHDVDRHEALNGDVEALWATTFAGAVAAQRQGLTDAIAFVNSIDGRIAPVMDPVNELTAGHVGTLVDAFGSVIALANSGVPNVNTLTIPPSLKEPNTVEDDFGSRATFGGVGDRSGSYNSYPAYADGFHLFFDATPVTQVCPAAYTRAPVVGESNVMITCVTSGIDPVGASTVGRRSSGTQLTFSGYVFLWHDRNADTYTNWACDPNDPEEWDSDRGSCKIEHHRGYSYNAPEVHHACPHSDVLNGELTLTPLGGNWPSVIVARDFRETTRVAFDQHWEVVTGNEPIKLRWEEDCGGGTLSVDSRDALIAPGGFLEVPIRVESSAGIASFSDPSLGIELGAERVIDVDYLAAVL